MKTQSAHPEDCRTEHQFPHHPFITDMKNLNAVNGAYREIFKSDPPARVVAETGLVSPDALVEIMLVAAR